MEQKYTYDCDFSDYCYYYRVFLSENSFLTRNESRLRNSQKKEQNVQKWGIKTYRRLNNVLSQYYRK